MKGSLQFSVSGLHTGCLQLVTKEVQTRDAQGRVVDGSDPLPLRQSEPLCDRARRAYDERRHDARRADALSRGLRSLGGGTLAELVERNIVSVPVERIRRRDGLVVSGELFGYDECGNPTSQSRLEKDDLSESLFRLSNKSSAGAFAPEAAAPHSRRMRATPKFSRHASTTTAI